MSMQLPMSKPRNPLATLARQRLAGKHQNAVRAHRAREKQDLQQALTRLHEHPR